MAQKKSLCVIVRGSLDKNPKEFQSYIESLSPDFHVFVPQFPISLFNTVKPELIAEHIRQLIRDEFENGHYQNTIIIAYSSGGPLTRYALALGMGFNEKGEKARDADNWAQSVERIIYLSPILRGWSISTATPPKIRFILPPFVALSRVFFRLFFWDSPFFWKMRRNAPFISNARLLDIAREKWCEVHNCVRPYKIILLGTRDEIISPADIIERSGSDRIIFTELSGKKHRDMVDADSYKQSEQAASTLKRAIHVAGEVLKSDPSFAISQDDINDYFDPLDRPLSPSLEGQPEKVTHAVMIIHGIRDEGFWTKRIAKTIKMKNWQEQKTEPVFIRAPSPGYGFFSMLDFARPWVRRNQADWFLAQYAEVRDCYRDANISFVGHSNGTYLAGHALKTSKSMLLHNVYMAGSVLRTDYPWEEVEDQISGKVLNVAGSKDSVIACLPGAMQKLGLRFMDVGGAGFEGFKYKQPERSNKTGTWLYNKREEGGHGAGIKEELWQQIADFSADGSLPQDAVPGQPHGGRESLKKYAATVFVVSILFFLAVILGLIIQTFSPLFEQFCGPQSGIAATIYCAPKEFFEWVEHCLSEISFFSGFMSFVSNWLEKINYGWLLITGAFFWLTAKFLKFF